MNSTVRASMRGIGPQTRLSEEEAWSALRAKLCSMSLRSVPVWPTRTHVRSQSVPAARSARPAGNTLPKIGLAQRRLSLKLWRALTLLCLGFGHSATSGRACSLRMSSGSCYTRCASMAPPARTCLVTAHTVAVTRMLNIEARMLNIEARMLRAGLRRRSERAASVQLHAPA
jgi:hypothetical protein